MNCMKKEANTINQPRPPSHGFISDSESTVRNDLCCSVLPDASLVPPNDMFSVIMTFATMARICTEQQKLHNCNDA